MKKIICSLVVVLMLIGMLPTTAFAHGGCCGGRSSGTAKYASCNVDDCEIYGPHQHNGNWYCNQSGVNWNNYSACSVQGCAQLGFHKHSGQWYHCYNYPNGGGYRGSGRR